MLDRETVLTLDQLQMGQTATVVALTSSGPTRRRFMDLGILPGTKIQIELRSPLRDPTAYNIKGAVIAIRREQASQIQISIDKDNNNDARPSSQNL